MKWTKERPTQSGYYWYRSKRVFPQLVEVHGDGYQRWCSGTGRSRMDRLTGQWAGPIAPPEEEGKET